jgi:adenylate cyclase
MVEGVEYPPVVLEPPDHHYAAAILGGPAKYTLAELAELTGLKIAQIENYWLWLGIPARSPDHKAYTEGDLASLSELSQLVNSEEIDESTLQSLIRAVGHSTERLATWQAEAFVDQLVRLKELDDPSARQAVVDSFPNLIDPLSRQLDHAWRRATVHILERFDSDSQAEKAKTTEELPLLRAIGFADIVGYTQLSATLAKADLAEFLNEKELRARDIVNSRGGWVIKTIGDAIMFGAHTAEEGAVIALELSNPVKSKVADVQIRVGLVFGRILARFGDAFGTSVNLAARLTSAAEPGTVLTDTDTAKLLIRDHRFRLTEMPEVPIKGLGTVRPVKLENLPG